MASAPQSGARLPDGASGSAPNFPVDMLNYAIDVDPLLTNRYPNAAARTAAIPTPYDGQLSFLASPRRHEEYVTTISGGTVNAWVPLNPGRLGGTGALVTNVYGNFGSFNALQRLTNLQVFINRWYRISWSAFVYGGAGSGVLVNRLSAANAGQTFAQRETPFHNTTKDDRAMVTFFHDYQAPATRLETFTLEGFVDWQVASTTSNPTVDISSSRNASFTVDDMGWSI